MPPHGRGSRHHRTANRCPPASRRPNCRDRKRCRTLRGSCASTIARAMILPVHSQLRQHIRSALTSAFGLAETDQPAIVIEVPPRRALGDLAIPVAFELARRLRKAPRVIAQELATALGVP